MSLSGRLRRPGVVGLAAGFVVLALAGAMTIHAGVMRQQSGYFVRRALNVQKHLHHLFALVSGAESAERGYLITSNETYLVPYHEALRYLDPNFDELSRLLEDNPRQQLALTGLRLLVRQRMANIKTTVDLVVSGRADNVLRTMRTGTGDTEINEISRAMSEMMTAEQQLLERREDEFASATATLELGVMVLIGVTIALAVYAIATAHNQLSAISESNAALRAAHGQLIEAGTRREELEAQLRQSQKLDAIGQLAGGIAHDFNNMLSIIVSSLNILRRRLARGDDQYEQFIDSALDGADRAAKLVRRLLAFARQQPLAAAPLDANQLVADMTKLLRRALGEQVRIETALAEGLWRTEIDANELEHAIMNLAVNARDAMPEGGVLKIETANRRLVDADVSGIEGAKPGDYIVIVVSDTGFGMPPDVAAKAFDPFFTTKPVGKGTGLGLSQVYGFVKQSGGHIVVRSELGKGTSITMFLPRCFEDAPALERPQKKEDYPLGRSEEIVVVVEDEGQARQMAAECVRELGYTPIAAENAAAAVRILDQRSDVSLLMTDLLMPGMSGRDLAREARRRRPGLRVLFMSGYVRDAALLTSDDGRAEHLLAKPLSLDSAARKIREAIDAPEAGGDARRARQGGKDST